MQSDAETDIRSIRETSISNCMFLKRAQIGVKTPSPNENSQSTAQLNGSDGHGNCRICNSEDKYDDDDDDETWIYIAHRHKISNALYCK